MEVDTAPLVRSKRIRRMILISEINETAISLNQVHTYDSDRLPEWFRPLRPIVEDETFTRMLITLGDLHYLISIAR